jgi:hypothetical protein
VAFLTNGGAQQSPGGYRIFVKKVQIRKGDFTWRIDKAVASGIPELDLKRRGYAYRIGTGFLNVRRFWVRDISDKRRDRPGRVPQPNLGRMPSILEPCELRA